MPAIQGHVATDRASRYLQQLCSHASRMRHLGRHADRHAGPHAEATSDTAGRITRGTAVCELTAGPTALSLHLTAEDEQQLKGLQEAVTRTLERAGRRDGLTVVWE
ncbi:hypothetical protein ABIA31_005819 [Catenulispora sp. MAP5-51]|uniref:DUF2218 domain-containing protein n=1 Tax=Catenulispora sp. MAP5-51 TaxID=3156298 RepID=UPI003514E971